MAAELCLAQVEAAGLTVRGISVGGVYTCLQVPELDLSFDVGIAPRTLCGSRHLLLSHGHVDHIGALLTLLGQRALVGQKAPLHTLMPLEMVAPMHAMLQAASGMQRHDLQLEAVGMRPGDAAFLHADLWAQAVRTHHSVPSLGYIISRRVDKLKPALRGLPGVEIAARKQAGEAVTDTVQRPLLAYITDSLIDVLPHHPELFQVPLLILESTFLDARKSVAEARRRCHVHLDEIIAMAERFDNEALVLMHFSQHHSPAQVHALLAERLPACLRARVQALLPSAPGR
ncbi:MAG: MBL fold metallo-hydrolase [Polyangiales bacterium]